MLVRPAENGLRQQAKLSWLNRMHKGESNLKLRETDLGRCIRLLGFRDKITQSGWLRPTESVAEFWKRGAQNRGDGRVSSF